MAAKQYVRDGLIKFKGSNPNASKDDYRREALRLEREYSTKTSGERNIERAKQMFAGEPTALAKLEAMQKGPEEFGREIREQAIQSTPYAERYKSRITGEPRSEFEARALEAAFPYSMEAIQQDRDFSPMAAIASGASLPGRAFESATYKLAGGDMPFSERMAQTEGTGFVSEAIRSPYNVMPQGRLGAGLASVGKPLAQRGLGYFAKGAAETAPSAVMEQLRRLEEGKGIDVSELGAEVALGGAIPVIGKGARKALFGSKDKLKGTSVSELAKDALSIATGKSKELLDYVGGEELKTGVKRIFKDVPDSKKIEKIKNFHEKSEEIVTGVVDYIDNQFKDRFVKANPRVQQALSEMPEIDISDIVLDLNRKKKALLDPRDKFKKGKSIVPPGHRTGDQYIDVMLAGYDNVIDKLTGRRYGEQSFKLPANQLYDIRKDIDKGIAFDKTMFSTGAQKDVYNIPVEARRKIANKLEDAGAKTSFPADMKEFHTLLDLRDNISKKLGDGSNLDKTQRFMLTLGNPSKLESKILANKLKKILGKDLFEEAQLLKLSREYKDGLGVYNDISTGRSLLGSKLGESLGGKVGAAVGTVMGSPAISAPAYGLIKKAEDVAPYVNTLNRYGINYQPITRLTRSGMIENVGE